MKINKLFGQVLFSVIIIALYSCDKKPYDLRDGYIYIQKEERRNESTEWQLVWEDDFNKGTLDTSIWSRIGLFESPKWKVPVEKWKEVNNCFRYITATDPRVVEFDDENIFLKGIINPDSLTGDPRPYLTGGIYSWNKFAFQGGRIEIKAKLDPKTGQVKQSNPDFIKTGDAAIVQIRPTKPLVIEKVKEIPQLGRFAIRDMGQTIAAGMCIDIVAR